MEELRFWEEQGREELMLRTYSEAIYELAAMVENRYIDNVDIMRDINKVIETGKI